MVHILWMLLVAPARLEGADHLGLLSAGDAFTLYPSQDYWRAFGIIPCEEGTQLMDMPEISGSDQAGVPIFRLAKTR